MANGDNYSRVQMRKRFKDPDNDDNYFDVPVSYRVPFKVMAEQAQVRVVYVDNSAASSRLTHTKTVKEIKDRQTTGDGRVDVERIDGNYVKDTSVAQKLNYALVNNDPPPMQADGSNVPGHYKTRYVRYFQNNDEQSEVFGDVELIEEIKFKEAGQEWTYFLKHYTGEGGAEMGSVVNDGNVPYTVTRGYCDPSLPMAPDESGG